MVRLLVSVCVVCVLLCVPERAKAEKKEFSGLTLDEVTKQYNELSDKGWTPISVTGKAGTGKDSVYDMTWVDDKIGGWYIFVGMTSKEMVEKKEEMKKQGLKLHKESSWTAAGEERCAGVWLREPDGRSFWVKKTWTLEHIKGKLWEEKVDGKFAYHYVEEGRTKEYVEMIDKNRNVTLRVYADRIESKGGRPKDEFKKLYDGGKWGSK